MRFSHDFVIPAQAGIQGVARAFGADWISACAGMTNEGCVS
jgi:hypothetical protein